MLEAIGRLLAITLVVIIVTVFAVVFMRRMGTHQDFQAPPHAWFQKAQWDILAPPVAEICRHPGEVGREGWILNLPIQRSKVGANTWEIPCAGAPLPLQDFLVSSKQAQILLNIQAGNITDLDKLVDIARSFENSGKSFAVLAPAQKVARELRKAAPGWLFAADTASLLRLHMFESLWLETVMDFWPDFVLASGNRADGTHLSQREVAELRRRQKRIVWNDPAAPAPYLTDGKMTVTP